MQDRFPELCDETSLTLRFLDILQGRIESLRSVENAHAHGESPIFGEILDELKPIGIEQVIGGLPLWQICFESYLALIADNNRHLLKAVASLISDKS